VFFGWWVALSFALVVFLSTGIRFTIGPFLKPMVADLGIDRATFSLAVALSLFFYGAFMPFVGRLAERFGARAVIVAGTVVLAAATAGSGLVTRAWQLYLVYGLGMSLGLAATGHVVASAVIARWFVRRRATALSLLGSAAMGGMSLMVPVAMWLIGALGWRAAYAVLGAGAFLTIMPLALGVLRESPEAMGLAPDGAAPTPAAPAAAGASLGVSAAVQTAPFWQLALALSTCGFSMSLLSTHGVPMLSDHGYHPLVASWAFALLGGSNVAFAVVLGAIADRFGSRPVLAWIYGGRAVAFALLFLIHDRPVALLAVATIGGATMAGTFAMTSSLTAEIFGRFSLGTVFGTMFFVHQVGAALGSWIGGALFEATGGYGGAFTLACVILAAAAVVTTLLDLRPLCGPARTLSPVAGGR
jgi:MFS family permease